MICQSRYNCPEVVVDRGCIQFIIGYFFIELGHFILSGLIIPFDAVFFGGFCLRKVTGLILAYFVFVLD